MIAEREGSDQGVSSPRSTGRSPRSSPPTRPAVRREAVRRSTARRRTSLGSRKHVSSMMRAQGRHIQSSERFTRKERKQVGRLPPFSPRRFPARRLQPASSIPLKRTMQIAQKLYEGKELGSAGHAGLITIHAYRLSARQRTMHSRKFANISPRNTVRIFLPEKPNVYRVKKAAQAQDAHDGPSVRPSLEFDPEQNQGLSQPRGVTTSIS